MKHTLTKYLALFLIIAVILPSSPRIRSRGY